MAYRRDTVPGLADKLREAREAAGLTQMKAGERSGVNHANIAKYETGASAPTIATLYRLAEAYGSACPDRDPSTARSTRISQAAPRGGSV
jgi:transcriptional regulator with XRE-family HTH domain